MNFECWVDGAWTAESWVEGAWCPEGAPPSPSPSGAQAGKIINEFPWPEIERLRTEERRKLFEQRKRRREDEEIVIL